MHKRLIFHRESFFSFISPFLPSSQNAKKTCLGRLHAVLILLSLKDLRIDLTFPIHWDLAILKRMLWGVVEIILTQTSNQLIQKAFKPIIARLHQSTLIKFFVLTWLKLIFINFMSLRYCHEWRQAFVTSHSLSWGHMTVFLLSSQQKMFSKAQIPRRNFHVAFVAYSRICDVNIFNDIKTPDTRLRNVRIE